MNVRVREGDPFGNIPIGNLGTNDLTPRSLSVPCWCKASGDFSDRLHDGKRLAEKPGSVLQEYGGVSGAQYPKFAKPWLVEARVPGQPFPKTLGDPGSGVDECALWT